MVLLTFVFIWFDFLIFQICVADTHLTPLLLWHVGREEHADQEDRIPSGLSLRAPDLHREARDSLVCVSNFYLAHFFTFQSQLGKETENTLLCKEAGRMHLLITTHIHKQWTAINHCYFIIATLSSNRVTVFGPIFTAFLIGWVTVAETGLCPN